MSLCLLPALLITLSCSSSATWIAWSLVFFSVVREFTTLVDGIVLAVAVAVAVPPRRSCRSSTGDDFVWRNDRESWSMEVLALVALVWFFNKDDEDVVGLISIDFVDAASPAATAAAVATTNTTGGGECQERRSSTTSTITDEQVWIVPILLLLRIIFIFFFCRPHLWLSSFPFLVWNNIGAKLTKVNQN